MSYSIPISSDLTITLNPDYSTGKSEYIWLELAERCKNYGDGSSLTYSKNEKGEHTIIFELQNDAQYFLTSFMGSYQLFLTAHNLRLTGNKNWHVFDTGGNQPAETRSVQLIHVNTRQLITIVNDGSLFFHLPGRLKAKKMIPVKLMTTEINSEITDRINKLRDDGHWVYVNVNRKKPHQPKTQTVIYYAEDEDAAVLFKLTHM